MEEKDIYSTQTESYISLFVKLCEDKRLDANISYDKYQQQWRIKVNGNGSILLFDSIAFKDEFDELIAEAVKKIDKRLSKLDE